MSIDSYIRENHGTVNVNITKQVEAFREAPRTESKTDGSQVKLTATQKVALRTICDQIGIGVSTFISRAIDDQLEILPRREKLLRYKETVFAMLDTLP
jgi:hypothetical protein